MATIPLPAGGLTPLAWLEPVPASFDVQSGFTGARTVLRRGGVLRGWRARLSVVPGAPADNLAWRAFRARLEGNVNTFRLPASEDQAGCPLATATVAGDGQRKNLLLRSDAFANAAWTKTAVTIGTAYGFGPPDIATSTGLNETTATSGHHVSQSVSFGAATWVTLSAHIRASNRTWAQLFADGGPSAYFDVINGTIGTIAGSGVTAAIVDAGNGFWRCSLTFQVASGATGFYIASATGNGGGSFAGTAFEALIIAGAQLEPGPRASFYIPTEAAAESSYRGLNIGGLTQGVTYLRAGQRVTALDRLFALQSDIVGGVGGLANLDLWPDLPRLTSAGAVVTLRAPYALMRLTGVEELGDTTEAGPVVRPFDMLAEEVV